MKKKYILMMISIVVLGSLKAQNPSTYLDSALIACYSFNGNALDGSGNGNNGIVNGATLVSDRFGNNNSAYSFNGSSNNIVVPAFNTKINSNEFSLSFWATSGLYATRSPFLLVPDDAGNRLNVHIYYGNQLSNSQTFFDWGDISWGGRLYVAGSPLPAAGSWDHWVFTTSAVNYNMNCYKNGVLQYTQNGSSSLITGGSSRDLLIGGGVGLGSSYLWFDGSLDDIKLYARVLTQNDVTALYTRTATCKGVVTTGIENNSNNISLFNIYPNPSNTGIFTISELSGSSEVSVRTLTGEVIKTLHASSPAIDVDIKEYRSGIYFLNIKNSTETFTRKLIKE